MRGLLFVLLSLLMPCVGSAKEIDNVDPEKAAVILELLKVTGSLEIADQIMARLDEIEKEGASEEEKAKIDRFAARLDSSELTDEIVVLYDRHFAKDDLIAILKFYKSDVGVRMIEKLPILVQESMQIGEAWGERKAAELRQELESEGDGRNRPVLR